MPLTSKGEEIKKAMEEEYGKEKGEQVFYASKNAGTISGVDQEYEESIVECVPEYVTPATINEQNQKYWHQYKR